VKEKVRKYIQTNQLFSQKGLILVGVSGGADSVALLLILKELGYQIQALHCNFHLRQEEADRDEKFVSKLCQENGIPLLTKHFNTKEYAKAKSISVEMAARELRYEWFYDMLSANNAQCIAVAHHKNDQAETLLLNLKRGTGLRGLAGMRPKSANPMVPEGVPVVRPLLCTTRDYIEHYLRDKRHLNWVIDSTNSDTTIARNAIREQLKQYSKSEIEHIAQTAEYMQGYADVLDGKETREAGIVRLYEELREYNFAEIDKIYDALQRGEGGKIFRSKTHEATIKKRKLCVTSV
jgi:tRNA(Ile)-lysidine synthase